MVHTDTGPQMFSFRITVF